MHPRELKARQNYELHQRALRFRAEGHSHARSAEMAGASGSTFWRLEKRVREEGIDGYLPRTENSGRHSDLVRLRVPSWVLRQVERIAMQSDCSISAAWRQFALSPECPPALAARLRRSIPGSFIKATSLRNVQVRMGRHVSIRESLAIALQEVTP